MARYTKYGLTFAYAAIGNDDKIIFGNMNETVSMNVLETMLKVISPIGHTGFLEKVRMLRRKNDYVVFNLEGFEENFKLKRVMKICRM